MATQLGVRFVERAGAGRFRRRPEARARRLEARAETRAETVELRLMRQRLLERAAELWGDQWALRQLLPVGYVEVKDDEEYGVDHAERETISAILDMKARMMREVQEAIRRVDAGRYGTCEDCEQAIPPARLRALPFTPRCRDCQQVAESSATVSP
jgi:RNA polymerase-binding transcription factor DksA